MTCLSYITSNREEKAMSSLSHSYQNMRCQSSTMKYRFSPVLLWQLSCSVDPVHTWALWFWPQSQNWAALFLLIKSWTFLHSQFTSFLHVSASFIPFLRFHLQKLLCLHFSCDMLTGLCSGFKPFFLLFEVFPFPSFTVLQPFVFYRYVVCWLI